MRCGVTRSWVCVAEHEEMGVIKLLEAKNA